PGRVGCTPRRAVSYSASGRPVPGSDGTSGADQGSTPQRVTIATDGAAKIGGGPTGASQERAHGVARGRPHIGGHGTVGRRGSGSGRRPRRRSRAARSRTAAISSAVRC